MGDVVSTGLDVASDVLGPVGVFAGLGLGIYDEIEQEKQAKAETAQAHTEQLQVNTLADKPTFSSGSRAMPSFDTTQFRSGGLMNF